MIDNSALPQREHFFVVEDDKGRKQVLLTESTYSIGRGPDCDIRLRSQFVSRHHATLYRKMRDSGESYYEIVDGDLEGKASVNGMLVNGRKLSNRKLKHGDKVVFGPQVFAVYQYKQHDHFPTMPFNDPFDITLIDPSMMQEEEDGGEQFK